MTRRRRLVMIVHGPYPVAEPRVEQQALAARDAGWSVEVVALRRAGEPLRETRDGIDVVRARLSHRRGARLPALALEYAGFLAYAAVHVLRRTARRAADVVQVHAPPDLLVLAALPVRLRRGRVVLDIHDRGPDLFSARYDMPFGERLLRWAERCAVAVADEVVTVHEPYRRALVGIGLPGSKVSVVMNSPRADLIPSRTRRQRDAAEPLRAVYGGTLTSWYGVGTLVDAIALLRDRVTVTLEVWGEGDDTAALRRHAAAVGLADAVTLREPVAREDLLRRVADADVGVVPNLPTTLNGFALSTKLLELVAIGVPVVCSDLSTFREHFSGDEVRYFEAGNAASLADALADVARDPDAAAARAARARDRFEAYAWERSRRTYLELLERRSQD